MAIISNVRPALLLHVVQHAARYAFEPAGFVERPEGAGNNPHAQCAVIAGERKLLER